MGKVDDMEASTSEGAAFKFIAPDLSNFLADPETMKMVKKSGKGGISGISSLKKV